jgi:alpha-tubulin suppressor-like RCC1 family protein
MQVLDRVTAVSAGDQHSLALRDDGTVWAWGLNEFGELGDGTSSQYNLTPAQAQNLTEVTEISSGYFHSLALKDGVVWAWGDNTKGNLGDGTTTQRRAPVQAINLSRVSAIAGGNWHSHCICDQP